MKRPALGQFPANVRRRVQAVFGGLAAAHDAHRARLVEPERVAGAVEHQRHIRDAGKRQRIVRVVKRQDAHTQIIAPHHQRGWTVPGPAAAPAELLPSCCKTKFCRIAGFPGFLCTAKGIQHTARMDAGRPSTLASHSQHSSGSGAGSGGKRLVCPARPVTGSPPGNATAGCCPQCRRSGFPPGRSWGCAPCCCRQQWSHRSGPGPRCR